MRYLVVGLVIAVLVTVAHAQSAGPPTYTVGDSWKRSNGQEISVVRVEDGGYTIKGFLFDCPACLSQLDKHLVIVAVTDGDGKPVNVTSLRVVVVGPGWRFYDWPLEVKKNWTISATGFFKGNPFPYTVGITVKSYDDVKTPAGVFRAYKMEQSWSTKDDSSTYTWVNTSWYAPDVKNVVKFSSNNPNIKDWELVSYTLK